MILSDKDASLIVTQINIDNKVKTDQFQDIEIGDNSNKISLNFQSKRQNSKKGNTNRFVCCTYNKWLTIYSNIIFVINDFSTGDTFYLLLALPLWHGEGAPGQAMHKRNTDTNRSRGTTTKPLSMIAHTWAVHVRRFEEFFSPRLGVAITDTCTCIILARATDFCWLGSAEMDVHSGNI